VTDRDHLRRLPKVELHCHVEGTLRPATVKELAAANGLQLPVENPDDLYDFRDLDHFVEIYLLVCNCLMTRDDFHRMAYESLEDAARAGVRYREMFYEPGAHIDRGVSLDAMYEGLVSGIEDAEADFGVRCRLILDVDKRRGAAFAQDMVEYAATKDRDVLIGVGGAATERGVDHRQFVPALKDAARHGLRRTFHAGEDGPVENIRICVEEGGCERVDHGFRLLDDPELARRIAAERVPVTSCPTSNLRIANLVGSIPEHPFAAQRELGVLVTLNSDDPAMISADVGDEFGTVAEAFGYSLDTMEDLALDSVEASWLDDDEKRSMRREFVEEFNRLRADAGLSSRSFDQVPAGEPR
jgi:adenosine deaminase